MKMETLIAIIISSCLMGGCAGTYTKKDTGTALGALTGGALAYGLGQNSSNKEIWTVLGIGLGAMMGSQIGAQLDQRDRFLAGKTFTASMEHTQQGKPTYWANPDSGNSGTFTPTRTYQTNVGQYCREFTTTVYVGGQAQQGYGTACRQADGSWKIR